MASKNQNSNKSKILIYGSDMVLKQHINYYTEEDEYIIDYKPYKSVCRFSDYNIVILFQGIFESFTRSKYSFSGNDLIHNYDKNELDKRSNELRLLYRNGGCCCFLLCMPFLDQTAYGNYTNTDLSKLALNKSGLYRSNFEDRLTGITCLRPELERFISLYGGAISYFRFFNVDFQYLPLFKIKNETVGMLIDEKTYFIPTLLPDNDSTIIAEYFNLLISSLYSFHNKIAVEIPTWANNFIFTPEEKMIEDRKKKIEELYKIDNELDVFNKFKKALCTDGPKLVECIEVILKSGFGFKIDNKDDFKEDLKILDENSNPIIFIEVKGTNRNVQRDNINQADSHRERANLGRDFPSLLIINTLVNKVSSFEEKDHEINSEQIRHAAINNILILRTIDLLFLLDQLYKNKISYEAILELFKTKNGWMKVDQNDINIFVGEE